MAIYRISWSAALDGTPTKFSKMYTVVDEAEAIQQVKAKYPDAKITSVAMLKA